MIKDWSVSRSSGLPSKIKICTQRNNITMFDKLSHFEIFLIGRTVKKVLICPDFPLSFDQEYSYSKLKTHVSSLLTFVLQHVETIGPWQSTPKSTDLLEGKSGAPRSVFFARVSISAYNSRLIFCLRARLKKSGPRTRPGVNPTYKINLDQQNQIVFKSSRFFYT